MSLPMLTGAADWPQILLARAADGVVTDLAEAEAYLAHPVLGARLVEAAEAMLLHAGTPPEAILGGIDALKLRSSMTLFAQVPGAPAVFREVLDAFHAGEADPQTLLRIGSR